MTTTRDRRANRHVAFVSTRLRPSVGAELAERLDAVAVERAELARIRARSAREALSTWRAAAKNEVEPCLVEGLRRRSLMAAARAGNEPLGAAAPILLGDPALESDELDLEDVKAKDPVVARAELREHLAKRLSQSPRKRRGSAA